MGTSVTPGRFTKPEKPFGDEFITLRPFSLQDVAMTTALCQDPEIPRWTTVPAAYGEADARAWISAHEDQWLGGLEASLAITDANSGELIGSVGLFRDLNDETTTEVGYWVGAHSRGRGVATRAVTLLCEWGVNVARLQRVRLVTLIGNTPSERVAMKSGFTRVGEVLDYRSERRPDSSSHVTVWQKSYAPD